MCGDSKKNSKRTRLFLLPEIGEKPCMVTCHNCGVSKPANMFFLEYFPNDYKKENLSWNERSLSGMVDKLTTNGRPIYEEHKEPSDFEKLVLYRNDINSSKKKVGEFLDNHMENIRLNVDAVKYMESRNIPTEKIDTMMVLKKEHHDQNTFRYAYLKDYIIIPFLDKENKPYFYHSRRFRNLNDNRMSPYLMCHIKPDSFYTNFFMNEERVDPNKTVVIVEGTLDSFHIDNAISVNGIKRINDETINHFENRFGKDNIIYAVDNEMIDKDAKEKVKFLLQRHKSVFLWGLMAKKSSKVSTIKDFNQLCCLANQRYIPIQTIKTFSTTNMSDLME